MFKEFFVREVRGAIKTPMVWIFFFVLGLLAFGATSSSTVQIGGSIGNVYKNAPYVITQFVGILSIFGILIATAFFNNAALRDYSSNFNEIIFSTPLSRSGYFFGRFLGALVISTIPLLGVYFGIIIGGIVGPLAGWIDPDKIGPYQISTFINTYLLFILPNMFIAGTIIYSLANRFKSTTISFVGALLLFVGYLLSSTFTSDIENEMIAAIVDPFGLGAFQLDTRYFTPLEKNTLSPGFSGVLFTNRIIWTFAGILFILLSYSRFSFKERNKRVKKQKSKEVKAPDAVNIPKINPEFKGGFLWKQFITFFNQNFRSIYKSTSFQILFIFNAIMLLVAVFNQYEYFGLQSFPITYNMNDMVSESAELFLVIILVFFSGELVWRDRNSKIHEVIDSTPHNSFISLLAKAASLITLVVLIYAFCVLVAVIYQVAVGYTNLELGIYFWSFIYSEFPTYAIWALFMIFIQVLVNNKYLGYFLSILIVYVWSFVLLIMDVSSNMLRIGAKPGLTYSDMNEFGHVVTSIGWFNLYWVLFAILSLLVAGLIWVRGYNFGFVNRVVSSRKNLSKSYLMVFVASLFLWIGTAGFVFYNTQVLNEYNSSDESELLAVDYEKKYKQYEDLVVPKAIEAKYFIDIFPNERDVFVKAEVLLANKSSSPIDSIPFTLDDTWKTNIDIPNAEEILFDEEAGFKIYLLKSPLQPGDSMRMTIETSYVSKGFENGFGNSSVLNNGTFLNNFTVMPYMGYNSSYELSNKNDRKKYDLPERKRMPKLERNCSDKCYVNYLSDGKADWVKVETIISTSNDQLAIAPGSLVKEWQKDDRNYYHYKVDHPSQNFYSFISADYQVDRKKWNGIDIEVYYDSKHPYNIDMMSDAIIKSLKYYTENFGPYYHKQARIIEFPRYATFAQAFPGTMPYSEAFGFIIDLEDTTSNNVIDAVIAHEMAHQWWAHQEVSANMQGATMLTESFSEYSSLMVMKQESDPVKMREFLKYNHNRYLRGRSGETEYEVPLYKVENQGYIHYGKGSVILYALQDYIGEEIVNEALREFLSKYRYAEPPYPTSYDFLDILQPKVPDSLQYLIDDWFLEITLYDNRLKTASFEELDNGKYLVNLDIEAYKIKADSIGMEERVDINDWIDIGVYADADEKELIYEKRIKFTENKFSLSFEVDSLPVKAAIDPRRILIEREYNDNVKSFN